jgi:repressor LexA
LLGNNLRSRTIDDGATDGDDAPTERQMEIYAFIRDKIHSRGYGPTVREIGTAFKIRSPNGVVCHLKALERKGLITRGKNMSRAIELVAEPAHVRGLPLAGWVAAGTLRPAEEQSERIDFESLFKRDNHFVLKVMGDSMIDAGIFEGDTVIIQRCDVADNGVIVVALISGSLDPLSLGDRGAQAAGVDVKRTRVGGLAAVVLLVAAGVSVVGMIAFVGLVIPHAVRAVLGPQHRLLLLASAICGALVLLIADTVARVAVQPVEIPVGAITAIVGAPVFLVLLLRTRARQGGWA